MNPFCMFAWVFLIGFFLTVNSIKSAGKLIILTPNLSTPANTIHETMKKKNTSRVRLVVTNTYFGPNTYFHQADLPYWWNASMGMLWNSGQHALEYTHILWEGIFDGRVKAWLTNSEWVQSPLLVTCVSSQNPKCLPITFLQASRLPPLVKHKGNLNKGDLITIICATIWCPMSMRLKSSSTWREGVGCHIEGNT